jgi:hypothetical protein
MQTQITCPNCRTRFVAEVYQIIDVGQRPDLKQMVMSGYLNVAVCPNCRAATQMSGPVLYHDPAHELFMVYVPMELNMNQVERERMIGQLVKQAMDSLPADKRRGYMLNPQNIISMQTFMEKVLETEGITPEMLARQRKQMELLQTMATADKDVVDILLKERAGEIDEAFFALLRASIESANQGNQESLALKLINLQARLMRETETGRRLEQQQLALRKFQSEVKKQGGLSPALLLQHILANKEDEAVVNALISMGQPAINYEFFTLLTDKIEKREKTGVPTGDLVALRQRLLEVQEAVRRQSQQLMEEFGETLQGIMEAKDRPAAIRERWGEIDDTFMYLLSAQVEQAERQGYSVDAQALRDVQEAIIQEMENQAPPEIRLLNHLMRAESDQERRRLLDENQEMVTADFLKLLDAVSAEVDASGDPELKNSLRQVRAMVQMRVGVK